MLKNILFFLFFMIYNFSYANTIIFETERTRWVPWTIEYSQEWHLIEIEDSAPCYFRRNEFFENIQTLMIRDKNWFSFLNYLYSFYNFPLFPLFGIAILDKTNNHLIGTIRLKIHNNSGGLSFSYALKPQVRNCKLGQEIIHAFVYYIEKSIGKECLSFKEEYNKSIFMTAWKKEGVKEKPNFEYLASFFTTRPLQKIIASVDITNLASLSILIKNNFHPFLIECTHYILAHNQHLFEFDIVLEYPASIDIKNELVYSLFINPLLSHNPYQIEEIKTSLKEYFAISSTWTYLKLSYSAKSILHPLSKISYSLSLPLIIVKKHMLPETNIFPYCFIN